MNEEDWDILPNLNAPLASPPFSKDTHFPMLAPERSRKPSISDIIDVLNLKDERIFSWESGEISSSNKKSSESSLDTSDTILGTKDSSLNAKNDDLDSGYSESPTRMSPSSIGSASSEEYSPSWQYTLPEHSPPCSMSGHPQEKQRFFEADSYGCLDYPAEMNELSSEEKRNSCPLTSNTNGTDSMQTLTFVGNDATETRILNEENLLKLATESVNKTKLSIEAASSLLNSKDDAVIIVLEEDKTVKYMSTSRQRLENFLTSETDPQQNVTSSNIENVMNNDLLNIPSGTDNPDCYVIQPQRDKRRGRKRVYEPDKSEAERGDKKRERNNEACRKFRRVRKMIQKDLFEQESVLLQHNLNLKEQVAALTRQLAYMKKKLCMQE